MRLLLAFILSAPLHAMEGPPEPNLIIIGWDDLRADHVGAYGYKRRTTPKFDGLARKSCLFKNAISPSNWTLPVFMSWFTSLYPHQHRLTNKYKLPLNDDIAEWELNSISTEVVTLPQVLKARGYKTAGFTGGAAVSGHFGFDRGFDVYSDSVIFRGFDETFEQAAAWLKKNSDSKFFLFIHGYDVHGRFQLRAKPKMRFLLQEQHEKLLDFRERHGRFRMSRIEGNPLEPEKDDILLWRNVYDEKVFCADRRLGKFLNFLESLGHVIQRTVIVIASDHGEELFDHGGVDHGMTLYDEIIHVPLLIRVPWIKGRIIEHQVRTMDILPTVLALLNIQPDEKLRRQMKGVSLVPHIHGNGFPLDAFSETDYLLHSNKRSLRKADGWKLIYDGLTWERELYNLNLDPGERNNLFEKEDKQAYKMETELFQWMLESYP